MTIRSAIGISAMLCGAAMAESPPGNAIVEWIAESSACEPGKPLKTAIRMVHEPGWHSYWINPGEAGITTTVEWKPPTGWKCGDLGFPAPTRFLTSNLAGFGYGGTVLFPVTVTPPADFTGTARLSAEISWLACGEQGCVPGKVEIHLDLEAGGMKPTDDAGAIHSAYQKLPRPADDFPKLSVIEADGKLILSIEEKPGEPLNLDVSEFFPTTPDVVDPRVAIRFAKTEGRWTAEVPKSEYAAGPVKKFTLVLAPDGRNEAWELSWTAP